MKNDWPKFKVGDVVMQNYKHGSGATDVYVGKILSISAYDRLGPNKWTYTILVDWNKTIKCEEEKIFKL